MFPDLGEDEFHAMRSAIHVLKTLPRVQGGPGEPGELIDLSMLETQILGLTYYPVTYFEMLGRPWRNARRLTVPGVAQAKDGLVDLGCGTAQQWFDLCAMVGHPEWIETVRRVGLRLGLTT